MPKKKKRGRRTASRKPHGARRGPLTPSAPPSVDLPLNAEDPLVRLEFTPQATPEEIELAIRYWMPGVEGGWAELVTALGPTSQVAGQVRQVCTAYLLKCLCGTCASPLTAATRSKAAALAGAELRGYTGGTPLCAACRHALEQQQAEEARAKQERAQALEEAKQKSLTTFLECGGTFSASVNRQERRLTELPTEQACVLEAMINRAQVSAVLPAAIELKRGWMWEENDLDQKMITGLFENGWIRIDPSVSSKNFSFDEEGQIVGYYPLCVPYRLVTSIEETQEDMLALLLAHSRSRHLRELTAHVRRMEAKSLLRYLNGMLVERYHYPPIPEERLSELHEILLDGLDDYTFGQMVCFCWRAADTAAGWKERKGLSDAHASSATITILKGKIAAARECKSTVPKYDLPKSQVDPPALAAGRSLIAKLQKQMELSCELHDEQLPCSFCLGMLYAGGEDAREIRDHYTLLGGDGVRLRPDLATKPQLMR
ncbi:hypothetical protein GCM10027294_53470 [Marinactinospora endophytica]